MQKTIQLKNRIAEGYAIPVGPVNLVFITTEEGMIGCGAFDIAALERFGIPAAKMKPVAGPSIATIDEILDANVKEVNKPAAECGITPGMIGKEALELL
ncbi:DUF1805 domain-containing protein [Methanocalculus taiwanensis]|uniref:DUF1805 domain-containing protein n=1 Tax=Methanocalculus taiwanensis TaxID=106207 RepID=A0ABD4TJW4_9EURY|nr:DUF1805 domain-containing protein [Methanocalculus taiwanensis]